MSVLPFDVDVDGVGVTDVVDVDVGDGEVAVEARVENFPETFGCCPEGYETKVKENKHTRC
jgi:hypothetical protein